MAAFTYFCVEEFPLITPPLTDDAIPGYLKSLGTPGIIDLHVHFMPDRVQQKVWGFFDHLAEMGESPWPIAYRYTDHQRVEILRNMGVTAYSTLNYAHRPGMAAFLNEYSKTFAAEHKDAIHSATFYPEPGVEAMVGQVLDDGAKIFKIHIQVGGFSALDPALASSWELIAQAGVPVVMHCGSGPHQGEFTGPEPIFELVERYPELVLVIAHMGMPEYNEFAQLARQAPNVHLDTTMVGTDFFEQEFMPVPPDYLDTAAELQNKIVLGTDFPTIPHHYSHQIEALHNWGLGEDWMRKVLWENPKKLVNLEH
ncbi:MAG TPA: amidohydrolase [Candidatus Yaniella excrementigallinarum]|nr:amidohydrolase [Candidatus Yaniella excrementigallinarum]